MRDTEGADHPDHIKKVLETLEKSNRAYQLRSFSEPAHHAREAATLLGYPLGAVVKSLVFQTTESENLVLVLVSGKNRADIATLSRILGQSVRPANPGDILDLTGYAVGAVPPFGMKGEFTVIIDADLMTYDTIWSAAGSAYVLIGLTPDVLQQLSGGRIELIKHL